MNSNFNFKLVNTIVALLLSDADFETAVWPMNLIPIRRQLKDVGAAWYKESTSLIVSTMLITAIEPLYMTLLSCAVLFFKILWDRKGNMTNFDVTRCKS